MSDGLGPVDRNPVGSSDLNSGNSVSSRVGVHDLNEVPLGLANICRDIDELTVFQCTEGGIVEAEAVGGLIGGNVNMSILIVLVVSEILALDGEESGDDCRVLGVGVVPGAINEVEPSNPTGQNILSQVDSSQVRTDFTCEFQEEGLGVV